MTTCCYPNVKAFIINALRNNAVFKALKESRATFIFHAILCFAGIKGKINFLQMQRFLKKSEQYFRIHFANRFNFQSFNSAMMQARRSEYVIAFDPSYLPKSGKKTYGLDSYWSGCARAVKRGLEICGFAVVDTVINTAFHLNAIQTPKSKNFNLLQYYCQTVKEHFLYFKELSNYLVADAYFARREVVETIASLGMHFISRLHKNAALFYLNREPKTGKRGRHKKFVGKVNTKSPDMNYFTLVFNSAEMKVYNAIVYSKAFMCNINLSITVFCDEKGKETTNLYFSTDLKMDGVKIVNYYRSRFQIEFLYRDAKQHCGLEDCQARSKNKLDFHFNVALTTVNIAKLHWLETRKSDKEPFSMTNFKTLTHNTMMLERFLCEFAINPNSPKIQSKIKKLLTYGLIAA